MLCDECRNRSKCEQAGIPLQNMVSAMVGMCALQDLRALSITHSRELSDNGKQPVERVLEHIQRTYPGCLYCRYEAS